MSYQYDGNGGFQQNQPPKKPENNDVGSWILIAIMFMVAWPIGLFLLISKLNEGKKKGTVSSARTSSAGKTTQTKKSSPVSKVTRTPDDSSKGARTMKIIGGVLTALGAFACLGLLGDLSFYFGDYGSVWYFLEDLFPSLGLLAGGIALLQGGHRMTRRMRRFAKYLAAAGSRTVVPISYLAGAAEVSERRVEKDLDMMIEKGMWGKDAYVDLGAGKLFRSQTAAAAFYDQQGEAASYYYNREEKPVTPPEAEQGYSGILRDIRRANDSIADEALSKKIDRLEAIAGRIFRILEEEPEKKAKAGTFLNYYIPTTQKLLDSYAEFEEAGVNGGNLTEAKRKIERIMDNIVRGFEHQLDELYRTEAMDIDSDIRVMETMLRRDSSSAAEDFGLGGGTAAAVQDE